MAHDDLPLHLSRGSGPVPPELRPPSPTRWIVVGSGAVIAGAVLALWWMSRAQPEPTAPAPTAATEVALASKRPKQQPLELPALADSDTFMRDLVETLSRHPLLTRLFATRGVVRGATLAVVQIGDGKTPAVPLAALRPTSRLQIVGTASGRVDGASYARWEGAAGALVSVRPTDAAQVYVNVKPLFDEAYRELGHPSGDFDEVVVRAIRTLAATPDVAGDPVLLRRPTYFEHEDPALRSLLPVQKQLLLLGPDQRRRVMSWLRQFAATLELKID